jgi:hypothetical protein
VRSLSPLLAVFAVVLPSFVPVQALAQHRSNAQIATDLERLAAELRAKPEPAAGSDVPQGGSIVDAVTALLQTGGVVKLQPGVTYPGPIRLPARAANAPVITITTDGPLPNRRIAPQDAPLLATIATTDPEGAVFFENTAGYVLDGVRLLSMVSGWEVVVIQGSTNITLDRVLYCPGDASCAYNSAQNIKRVVRGNGRHIKLTRSYLNAGPRQGQDNQAFSAWDGAGPFTITDNTLMAGGENVLFGGSDNPSAATNPADILIDNNLLFKPQDWRSFPGSVKNLFELKNATRVIFSNNIMDGCWPDAQSGYAIVLTPVNQDGGAPWSIVKDVLIERNVLRNSARGINMVGYGWNYATQQTSGITVRKNVFETYKSFMSVGAEVADFTFEDNVVDNGSTLMSMYVGGVRNQDGTTRTTQTAFQTLRWNRNFQRDTGYGIHSEAGLGTLALNARTLTYTFTDNKFVARQYSYPAGTVSIDATAFAAAKAALLAEIGRN